MRLSTFMPCAVYEGSIIHNRYSLLRGYSFSEPPDVQILFLQMGQPSGLSQINGVFCEFIHNPPHIEGSRTEKNRDEPSLSLLGSLSFTYNASLGIAPPPSTSPEVMMAEISVLDIHDSKRLSEIAVIVHSLATRSQV